MKPFKHMLLAGLLLPLIVFSLEESFFEGEENFLSLEEELLLLDKEFNALDEKLFSSESENKLPTFVPPARQTEQVEEDLIASHEQPLSEESVVSIEKKEELVSADVVINEETPLLAPHREDVIESVPLISSLQEQSSTNEPMVSYVEEIVEEEPIVTSQRAAEKEETIAVDLKTAFKGSPMIYSLLFLLSVFAVSIWLYALFSLRKATRFPPSLSDQLRNQLSANHFDEALLLCKSSNHLFSHMIASGISSRKHGLPIVLDAMKTEAKRMSMRFWQNIGMLNDIAIIAPMLGLLGTVLGMFYAFYNVNRSVESVSMLFDGLGISVGTTVAGLSVAILALILYSTAKYRLVKALSFVENEAQRFANLIDDRTSVSNRG